MSAATRRAALGALLAAPLASGPAVAEFRTITPELARLIAENDRLHTILDAENAEDGGASLDLCRKAADARSRLAGFASRGLPDILAKAAFLARIWPIEDAEEDVRKNIASGWVCVDAMALNLACEIARYGDGTLCA